MPTIAEVREKYPQYADLSDEQLAQGLHQKYYSDMPYEQFAHTIGLNAQPEKPSIGQQVKRQLGLGARMVAEGAGSVINPWADAAGAILNQPLRAYDALRSPKLEELISGKKESFRFPTNHQQQLSQALTRGGLPEPQGGYEKAGNFIGQMVTGAAAGGPINKAITGAMGPVPPPPPNLSTAPAPGAATLENAGVKLDKSQRTGGKFSQWLRAVVSRHPMTAQKQADFSLQQQKDFTKAVLRTVGVNSDEASQEVMLAAKQRIGKVFDSVAEQGVKADDELVNGLADFTNTLQRTVLKSDQPTIMKNVDDIIGAVDENGLISGQALSKIRSNLSALSQQASVKNAADELEDMLLDALQRSYPGQRRVLQDAVDQYRNLKIIEPAIGKGAERYISPQALSNAVGSVRNRAMSIYGQGGDQRMVNLARAGRSVLPEAIPNSGTPQVSMAQAPLRAYGSGLLAKAGQAALLRQPKPPLPPGGGVLRAPAVGAANSLLAQLLMQKGR